MANTLALKIAGFGPRMMGTYRHEPGILPLACSQIEKRLLVGVQLANISLCLQPNENLREFLLKSKVDYIVLESTPVDVSHPAGKMDAAPVPAMRSRSNAKLHFDRLVQLWDRLRGEFFSIIEYLAEIDPMTPMMDYLGAIALVASACKSADVTAVVLTPLTRDFPCSTRSVAAYRNALRDLAKVQDILLVDCIDALEVFPDSSILQHDRRYLAPIGQQVVGGAIADSIIADVLTRSGRFEPLISGSTKVENNQLSFRHDTCK